MVPQTFTKLINVSHTETHVKTVPTVDHVTDLIEKVDTVVDTICNTNYVTDLVPVDTPVVTSHVRTSFVNVPACVEPELC